MTGLFHRARRRTSDPRSILALAAGWYAVFIWRASVVTPDGRLFPPFDDAAVSMQYARNLVRGEGLVWMAEGPRVEGYSNFLWTLWMAVLHATPLGEAGAPVLLCLTGLVVLLALAVTLDRLLLAIEPAADATSRALLMTATLFYYPLTFWTLRGMEVGLIALLVGAGFLQIARLGAAGRRRRVVLIAIVAALPLVRDDAAVLSLVLAAASWGRARPGDGSLSLWLLAAAGASVAAHFAFRFVYYGDWLPNTYYLKLTGHPVSARLARGISTITALLASHLGLLMVAAGWAGRRMPRERRRWLLLLGAPIVAQIAYSVWVGGDAWEFFEFPNRYVTPVVPLLLVIVAIGCSRPESTPATEIGWLMAGVGTALSAALGSALMQKRSGTIEWQTFVVVYATLALAAIAGAWWLARRRGCVSPRQRALALALVVAGLVNLKPMAYWLLRNAHEQAADANTTRIGLFLRRHTRPDAVIAVVRAGNTPYYAERTAVDLLGKSDRHVARSQPAYPFFPGHDKRDWDYSIGRLAPDVVAHVWWRHPGDEAALDRLGYDRLGNFLWIRRDLPRVLDGIVGPVTP